MWNGTYVSVCFLIMSSSFGKQMVIIALIRACEQSDNKGKKKWQPLHRMVTISRKLRRKNWTEELAKSKYWVRKPEVTTREIRWSNRQFEGGKKETYYRYNLNRRLLKRRLFNVNHQVEKTEDAPSANSASPHLSRLYSLTFPAQMPWPSAQRRPIFFYSFQPLFCT